MITKHILRGDIIMLPLGSIVYLKNGESMLMITNRAVVIEENESNIKIFEYEGCIYPIGASEKSTYFFNEDNIEKIVFKGYEDDEEKRFQQVYKEWRENNNVKILDVNEIKNQENKDILSNNK